MAKATNPFNALYVEVLTTGRNFRVTKEFRYTKKGTKPVVVPVDSKTDFASIPRPLTFFIPKLGKYTYPAVVHDYLCRTAKSWKERRAADLIFRLAMKDAGVGFLRRWAMWLAVWLAGLVFWKMNINGRVGKQADEDRREAERKAAQAQQQEQPSGQIAR